MRTYHLEALRTAASELDVVRLAQDYLALWTPQELASVPRHCRPGHVRDGEDIADAAMELTRARISSFDVDPHVMELAVFFAQACARVSQLEAAAAHLRARDEDLAAQ